MLPLHLAVLGKTVFFCLFFLSVDLVATAEAALNQASDPVKLKLEVSPKTEDEGVAQKVGFEEVKILAKATAWPRNLPKPKKASEVPNAEAEAMAKISGSTIPGVIEHLLLRPLPEAKKNPCSPNIAICYPSIGRSDVDADIRQWVTEIADSFEQTVNDGLFNLSCPGENDEAIELAADFRLTKPSTKALSITFELWNHLGGPHANLDVMTLNYSLINGQRLQLADIFGKPEVALSLMSSWARERLVERYGAGRHEMLWRGTEPLIENFSSLTLTPKGVSIHFQPYQVASWELGVQTVDMPIEALSQAQPLLVYWGK
ncbi:MAG: DUF3298 domain-containing protein [Desulfovibrio sp.]|nr:DUF3298 domain-containing protein [Desulfovibrio sp.]